MTLKYLVISKLIIFNQESKNILPPVISWEQSPGFFNNIQQIYNMVQKITYLVILKRYPQKREMIISTFSRKK